ncbi:hypothetical protein Cgig2_021782 [Carnegiea gigantea]|uniref:Uncharacterized protein n=1 Tax=Carnegiea gigantea TaxID=171969 RepID=A0A9Q1GGT0_9CARY|nr:hypothetical protein Cgig2_021782 [Carnegiea gigantea]
MARGGRRESISTSSRVFPSYASMVDPNEGTALEFIPATDINGTKCAKLVDKDNAVICCVLGANPPYEVIDGFSIDKVLLIKKGLYLVRDMIIRQRIVYEWRPIKCTHYKMFGHAHEECRKKVNQRHEWRAIPHEAAVMQQQPDTGELERILVTDQLIHREAIQISTNTKFLITFIYRRNLEKQRGPLWEDIRNLSHSLEDP